MQICYLKKYTPTKAKPSSIIWLKTNVAVKSVYGKTKEVTVKMKTDVKHTPKY